VRVWFRVGRIVAPGVMNQDLTCVVVGRLCVGMSFGVSFGCAKMLADRVQPCAHSRGDEPGSCEALLTAMQDACKVRLDAWDMLEDAGCMYC
jgi:hypothetical protein